MNRGAIDSGSARHPSYEVGRSSWQAARAATYPVIATEHLRLRAFELADISSLVATANKHHVADTALDIPYPFTAKHARQWIESHPAAWGARHSLHWAISLLADNRFVGYTGLRNINLEEQQAELSFWIAPRIERGLYAAEAIQAALAFAFATLQINRVCAFHLPRDLLAMRILTEIGLQQARQVRKYIYKWDQVEDVDVREILRSDWLDSL